MTSKPVKTLGDVEAAGYWLELECRGCLSSVKLPAWGFPGWPYRALDFRKYQCKTCNAFNPRHSLLIWSADMEEISKELPAMAEWINKQIAKGVWD